ncbi:hypothetical protein H257_18671 [Aphanomyces astaci]|uniref:SWIM-type domain-containing protein n=1 Tax=Aphanomyces astaci TaxID=112090 RepID=W4FC10_APHAT|nr:hypothetical protein H257_18671 [Aphanomyces astaci]ETV64454.1 hypothetical protein H257_18671 [Aphanomyces astaci]|eukprot:XP_009846067.1 hypothetical protein H257_18671 [Aphanomyces astaci]
MSTVSNLQLQHLVAELAGVPYPQWFSNNNPCELFNKHFKGIYTQRTVHGLCATFLLLGTIAEEISTYRAQPFETSPSTSKKLIRRFRRLVKFALLEVVAPNPAFESEVVPPIPAIGSEPENTRIRNIIPHFAISVAIAFEDEATEGALWIALQERGITYVPARDLALANAYYHGDRANNIRHESICGGRPQLPNGWLVTTSPGHLSCECNYFFKMKYCCHLLFALQPDEARQPRDSLAVAEALG